MDEPEDYFTEIIKRQPNGPDATDKYYFDKIWNEYKVG